LEWLDDARTKSIFMVALFFAGLLLVILEDHVGVNKSAIMLIVAATMWTFLAVGFHPNGSQEGREGLEHAIEPGVYDVGSIILFVLPAMGVVESIDHFNGFALVTHVIQKTSSVYGKSSLMPILGLLTFFFSAVIDNLTATILALKILRLTVPDDRTLRHLIGGLVVIAANAGGAWSPVGDVTTTMLWLNGKVTVPSLVCWLILPSFVAGLLPMAGLYWEMRRHLREHEEARSDRTVAIEEGANHQKTTVAEVTLANKLVLCLGIGVILLVPVLKMATGVPPYMGMLAALGIVWLVTDTHAFHRLAHQGEGDGTVIESDVSRTDSNFAPPSPGSVVEALHKMDLTGLLFFAGILLAVSALHTAGVLELYAEFLVQACRNSSVAIATFLGVSSAVVDNVPLVQAAIHMFKDDVATNDPLWHLVALAAGTGGSMLSIGSISGVTLMAMEGVGYLWYVRKVSVWALVGFLSGIGVYQLQHLLVAL
jgi:Na+/H+ antiporter NhaD/arsenite permease-like protein